jgi:hypothetical protein
MRFVEHKGVSTRLNAIAAFFATPYALSVALILLDGISGGLESRVIGLAYLSLSVG